MPKTMTFDKSPSVIRRMFNTIAHRYDMFNRCVSFGQDVRWRRKTAAALPDQSSIRLLDLATGTADLILMMKKTPRGSAISGAVGLDIAEDMLAVGQRKVEASGLSDMISLRQGDAADIPFDPHTFDAVTMAFGIRNVSNISVVLSEMFRVLKSNGRAVILEFSLPSNPLIRGAYLGYFRYVLPFVGGLITGDRKSLVYLNKSVEAFPYGNAFVRLMENAGFINVTTTPLSFGVAAIYTGDKP